MRTLILSAVLYLLGISVILLIKPEFMFKKDGTWKEFGLESSEHTAFPFWLFCILWAVVSYVVTLLIIGEYSDVKTVAAASVATTTAFNYPNESSPEDLVYQLPLKTRKKRKNILDKSEVGYHMLNREATEKSGVPKYLYVGDTPLKKPGYYVLNPSSKNSSKPKYDYVGNEDETSSEESSSEEE
jgi:hypothetical protein